MNSSAFNEIAARDPNSASVQAAVAQNPNFEVLPPIEAVRSVEVIFLATPFAANAAAIVEVSSALEGKILVDCTNPVGANLSHGLKSERSGAELVQDLVPTASVVKAFTIYGFENLEDNTYPGYGNLKPAMLCRGQCDCQADRFDALSTAWVGASGCGQPRHEPPS